jgi:hypothetical protein
VEQLRLGLDTLRELDRGKVHRAVDIALLRMQRDVEDRPFEPKPRVVTLSIELTPIVSQDLRLLGVNAQFQIMGKAPNHRSDPYVMHLSEDGILFNPDNLRDDAPTLPYHDERNDV